MEGYNKAKGAAFKELCLNAALMVQNGQAGYGILCDNRIGRSALHRASGSGLWIGRPTELPGSRPIQFESELGEDVGSLREWARENVVKLLVFCHPDDDDKMTKIQIARVKRLFTAARRNGLEFLLEIIPSKVCPVNDTTSATLIQTFYDAGIYPDWWKLEPFKTDAAWANAVSAIERNDPRTRGILVLGLDASEAELATSFALAAKQPLVKGFAVGRTIFGNAARRWMAGELSNDEAIIEMQDKYARLCEIWDKARSQANECAR
jgi:5-dehydro-2-deoxygluconokinase